MVCLIEFKDPVKEHDINQPRDDKNIIRRYEKQRQPIYNFSGSVSVNGKKLAIPFKSMTVLSDRVIRSILDIVHPPSEQYTDE